MVIEVWVVIAPGGDRPYCHAAPPSEELLKRWKAAGCRCVKLSENFSDIADPEELIELPHRFRMQTVVLDETGAKNGQSSEDVDD